MLFSSNEVAQYINSNFEPAWESVRPAPLVTIDFGNGNVVKRTLQGNIATYVCGADGTVYDVLPGIYAPGVYRQQLESLKGLAASLQPKPGAGAPANALAEQLRAYHTREAKRLQAAPPASPEMGGVAQFGGGGKFGGGGAQFGGFNGQPMMNPAAIARTGGGFKGGGFPIMGGGNFGFGGGNLGGNPPGFGGVGGFGGVSGAGSGFQGMTFGGIEGPIARLVSGATAAPGKLADRPELKLDSEVNERIRRKAIHEKLAAAGRIRPDDIKKWLYKDVLHADLDDPHLGLGALLNENYPFAEEDRAAGKK